MDDQGAESDKISDTWASVRHLQSEIHVVVASISLISREIHKLRDDKLLPDLCKLIEGYDNFALFLFFNMDYMLLIVDAAYL